MLTRLLDNIDPLPDDTLIVSSLGIDTQIDASACAICPTGIRNADGRIYRLVQAHGVGETMRLTRALQKLGFTEEDHESLSEGCNSTFRRRPALHH